METPPPRPAAEPPFKAGSERLDYVGGDAFVPDGYLRFKVAGQKGRAYPDHLKLSGGVEARVKRIDAGHFEISVGARKLLAVDRGNGRFDFYQLGKRDTLTHDQVLLPDGRPATKLSPSEPLARLFTQAHQVANGKREAHLHPAMEQMVRESKLLAQAGPLRAEADHLAGSAAKLREWGRETSGRLAEQLGPVMELAQQGLVEVGEDGQGQVTLTLKRPAGVADDEWASLQQRFGPALADKQAQLRSTQTDLSRDTGSRDRDAARLYETIHSPAMQHFLGSLPPEKRLQELNKYASALSGTEYGPKLAEELFGKEGGATGVPGTLAGTVLAGCYDTPGAREALKGLALVMTAELPTNTIERTERLFEVTMGRTLTDAERDAAFALATNGPDMLLALAEQDAHPPHGHSHAATRATLAAEMLAQLGNPEHGNHPGAAQKALKGGGVLFASFGALAALRDLNRNGASALSVTELAETSLRALSNWAEAAHALGGARWLESFGKVSGIGASTLGLVVDLVKLGKAETPEGKTHYVLQALGSVGIVAGLISSASVAPFIVAGLSAAKLIGGFWAPSDGYENATRALKHAL